MARLAAAPPTGATSDTNVAANPPLAAIEVDAQGDTAEDPNVIDESTSNSDNDSAEGTDKTTALCYSSKRLVNTWHIVPYEHVLEYQSSASAPMICTVSLWKSSHALQ